ncbi:hypothetical protein C8R46DRAFT_1083087 [Mycena filopes]|nr:hypothetical protein C8R46DRAFT_1083087 [Mycena filopes]
MSLYFFTDYSWHSVIDMYTKNTMHDWTPTVTSVGTPSYIYVSMYRRFAGALFTSMACEKLSCSTVLQIPSTHLLLSLASFTKITKQAIPASDGYPHIMVNLCPESLKLFEDLRGSSPVVQTAVQELGRLLREKSASGPSII